MANLGDEFEKILTAQAVRELGEEWKVVLSLAAPCMSSDGGYATSGIMMSFHYQIGVFVSPGPCFKINPRHYCLAGFRVPRDYMTVGGISHEVAILFGGLVAEAGWSIRDGGP